MTAAQSDAPPIEAHGLIGDLRSAALVALDGTIGWFCPGRFDAPSVFASLLDLDHGGHWRISPAEGDSRSTQFYFPDTNILVTRFMTEDGVVELQDFMPVGPHQRIVRRLVCVRGTMRLSVDLAPRFDYARVPHRLRRTGSRWTFATDALKLILLTDAKLEAADGDVRGVVALRSGDELSFVLHVGEVAAPDCHGRAAALELFDATVRYWREWVSRSSYTGRWRETVHRSALTLKLLTYEPTGAIVAAPTTSLPELVGGERNWDYRFVWMRDAAFSIYALIRLGFTDEAAAFSRFVQDRVREDDGDGNGPLQTMYRIDGTATLAEEELPHLAGYLDSRPVRVGNGAANQLQLDIYGELIDSIYLYDKYGTPISHESWMGLTGLLDWLIENWDRPDSGLWESRNGEEDHTFSRLMSWVAFERMIRMARQRGLPGDIVRWTEVRDEIYAQIMERGWNPNLSAFTQRLDDEVLDASLLLMPMVKFCAPHEPRFLATLDAIEAELVADTLVYRYDPTTAPDGLDGAEGTFSICSFWYVEALTRSGRLEDARLALEKMFTYANHVGLYAEEISPSGRQLGNFPQAFTHFSLISAAFNLDRALDQRAG